MIQFFGLNHILVLSFKEHPITITIAGKTLGVQPESLVLIDLIKPITICAKNIHYLSLNIPRVHLEKRMPMTENLHGYVLRHGPHYGCSVDSLAQ